MRAGGVVRECTEVRKARLAERYRRDRVLEARDRAYAAAFPQFATGARRGFIPIASPQTVAERAAADILVRWR